MLHKGYTGVRAERVKHLSETHCNEIAVFPSTVGNHTLISVTALGLHAWIWTEAQSVIDVDVPLQKKKSVPLRIPRTLIMLLINRPLQRYLSENKGKVGLVVPDYH